MLNKKDFTLMRKDIERCEKERDIIIKRSRDILRDSKRTIYSIHRNDIRNATLLLNKAKKDVSYLKRIISKNSALYTVGAFNAALQEYVEAVCYLGFVKENRLHTRKELDVSVENYLMGICDLTGELGRRVVALTVKKKFDEVIKIKDIVEEIYGEFLKFNLRNSELRKKSDSIKWNLKKIEDVIYDIKTKGMLK